MVNLAKRERKEYDSGSYQAPRRFGVTCIGPQNEMHDCCHSPKRHRAASEQAASARTFIGDGCEHSAVGRANQVHRDH